jgi:hypothetical protein
MCQALHKRFLNYFWWKALTPYLGPWINWRQEKSLTSLSPFCICCPWLWAILSFSHLGIKEGQECFVTTLWQGTETTPKEQQNLAGQTIPPNEEKLPTMMRLHPGAGIIMSWEPDCSPQVMTVIITSPEPSKNKDWDNDQQQPHWTTGTYLWLWLLNYAYFLSPGPNS